LGGVKFTFGAYHFIEEEFVDDDDGISTHQRLRSRASRYGMPCLKILKE